MNGNPDLGQADLTAFAKLTIPTALLQDAQVRRVTHHQAREDAGVVIRSGDLAGIWFPNIDPERGTVRGGRVRRDHPEVDADGKPVNKYVGPPGRHALYFPPRAAALLADVQVPVVIVESEKSTLAITAAAARNHRPLLVVATGGCWGWTGTIGQTVDQLGARVAEKGALPDWDRITLRGRHVVISFDSNAATNPSVRAARRQLSEELLKRGARVAVADVPVEDGVNGPDDYLAVRGDGALFELLDRSKPTRRRQDVPVPDLLAECNLSAGSILEMGPGRLEGHLRELSEALTGADRLRRAAVIAELKARKAPSAMINAALSTREEATASPSSPAITLREDTPASDPVNGAALLDETSAIIRRHVVLTQAQADGVALWVGAAHLVDALDLMPMLLISSPVPECGKSTAAAVVSALVPRPITVSSLTPAVLFRLIDQHHPTLIADEADAWLNNEKSELRGIFNASHWRSNAFIPRCVGETHEVKLFGVFGPKLIAMIGRPPLTMLTRSIKITLRRKKRGECVIAVRE